VTVEAVANIRFKDDATSLLIAGGRFLGKKHEEIKKTAQETLESNLRGVIGTLTVEDLIKDRDKFRQAVLSEAGEDLARLGMQIDVFNPQSIDDEQGYIQALGRKRTAEVVRDADIGEAEAMAEARKKSTDARRQAEIVAQDNEKQEQEAVKNKNVAVQQYNAEVAKETAVADQAGPLSTASERKKVVKAETEVDEERVKAEILVEQQRILKEQKAQEAAIVVPAKAAADATIRQAEGYKQAEISKADGDKSAIMARADASSHKMKVEGQGEADAVRAKGLAEAEVILKTGVAKAEALRKAAEAYREFGDAALTLEMMKAAPPVVEAFAPVFSAITAHLGNIDHLNVYDAGGNGEGKDGALARLAGQAPNILLDLAQQLQARGIDIRTLAQSAGIDLGKLLGSSASGGATKTPPPAQE
jgi:flotillin